MNRYKYFIICALIVSSCVALTEVRGQSVEELKGKIEERSASIQKLEQEIKAYQVEIDSLAKEKDTLSSALKQLDLSKKKLEADTKLTESKIAEKNLEIKALSLQIGDKNERIGDGRRVIAHALSAMSQMGNASLLEDLLGKDSLSQIWNRADELGTLQKGMQDSITDLESLRTNLESNKAQTEKKKAELVVLTNDLKNKTKLVAENVKEKNSILAETKNSEAGYKKLLATREAQKLAFEREIAALESALKIAIDPTLLPTSGKGVLRWPLSAITVTQYFGNTDFAKKTRIYVSGKGHNGIDLRAAIGTPIISALSGTVVGTGNMGKCSYGKWVMVEHANGLSTLYAHLSLINVTTGQKVFTSEVLGYSGNTGLVTGPHLHFGVYATQGVRIQTIASSCGRILYPLTDPSAYLDPISFLPAL
ncbi:MAG: peptidoglycan DD-metalloendopeptidase family protein [Patescibacteria group bacterium]